MGTPTGTFRCRSKWGVIAIGTLFLVCKPASARDLTIRERIEAQRAIERVYWSHRTWPSDNTIARPSFEQTITEAYLRTKVEDYLRKSDALATSWKQPITAEQLQAEVHRIEKSSQSPEALGELVAALKDDPVFVAECLARPLLVDRLIRNRYSGDLRIHGALRARAAAYYSNPPGVAGKVDYEGTVQAIVLRRSRSKQQPAGLLPTPGEREVPEQDWLELKKRLEGDGRPGDLEETDDEISITRSLEVTENTIRLERIAWSKVPFESWWQSNSAQFSTRVPVPSSSFARITIDPEPCQNDTWRPIPSKAPANRSDHIAVWTGSEMLVWGGTTTAGILADGGGRYDPATDTWRPMSRGSNEPSRRIGMSAVWTGKRLIIWGGMGHSDGAMYDPVADKWESVAANAALGPRGYHTAVWTGREMIVWSGYNGSGLVGTMGRYNPDTNAWTVVESDPTAPQARYKHTAVWTGKEMIVWGGHNGGPLKSGGRFNPETNTWVPTTTGVTCPDGRTWHTAVWTGKEMIIWGGENEDLWGHDGTNLGARYDPVMDIWMWTNTTTNAPWARRLHVAVWTGSKMLVWGGDNFGTKLSDGGEYDPVSDSWTAIPGDDAFLSGRMSTTAVWTGREMIIWGGFVGTGYTRTGGRYDPANQRWVATSIGSEVPRGRDHHTAVWTGVEMIVWGGGTNFSLENTGGVYSPVTDSWHPTSLVDAPLPREMHSAVWTGREMIIWGGELSASGGRYDPVTDTWIATRSDVAQPDGRYFHSAVWTGSEMIVWGGINRLGEPLGDGGGYDPLADAWRPLSAAGSPVARFAHSAAWTGNEMIVWGGTTDGPAESLDSGARYDPSQDVWRPVAHTAATPTARSFHSGTWSGDSMIVWGGQNGEMITDTGARYDPIGDAWVPIAPAPFGGRSEHTSIWTGRELIWWGGHTNDYAYSQAGARYDPSINLWQPTSQGDRTPDGRIYHTAVATGREMIVWGGAGPWDYVFGFGGSDGLYCYDGCAPSAWYRDADHDGYGAVQSLALTCTAPDGFVSNFGDCNDQDSSLHPGVPEVCFNRRDDDCSGAVDDNCPRTCPDHDLDHFDDCSNGCTPALGEACGDCNDSSDRVYPGAAETCNFRDDDCDGSTDDGIQISFYTDQDEDGWGDPAHSVSACSPPSGYVSRVPDNCPVTPNPDQGDVNRDGVGNACDLFISSPIVSDLLDCSHPLTARPTVTWSPGPYDKYKVLIAWEGSFLPGTKISSGDAWMTKKQWSPSGSQWRTVCKHALAAHPATPFVYFRIKGLDEDARKGAPERKKDSQTVAARVSP